MAIILLDLDGVLTDFTLGVCRLFGKPGPSAEDRGRAAHEIAGVSVGMMWQRVDQAGARFWLELEATPFANELVSLARRAGEIVVATSPSTDPQAVAGKVAWLQKRFGRRFRDFAVTPRKELLAAPGRLLVDDTPKHVEAFRAHGGQAVLLPTWSNGVLEADADPLAPVRAALDELQETR